MKSNPEEERVYLSEQITVKSGEGWTSNENLETGLLGIVCSTHGNEVLTAKEIWHKLWRNAAC